MSDRTDVYTLVTERVVAMMEAGVVPWHQPWSVGAGMPRSLSTRKAYRGINILLLGLSALESGYQSPWWGTYKKIKEMGGQVRRGEHATLVTLWRTFRKPVTDPTTGQTVNELRFVLRDYRVFNSQQADWPEGKAPEYDAQPRTVERIGQAEKVVAGYPNAPTITETGRAAFYRSAVDTVTMPPAESFENVDEYYSTMFHELTHSTGHDSRLNRDGVRLGSFGKFGDEVYSKEELVAELGAAMLCTLTGVDVTVTLPNSAAYLQSWINALRGDARLLVNAAAQAQRAVDHILGEHFAGDDQDDED